MKKILILIVWVYLFLVIFCNSIAVFAEGTKEESDLYNDHLRHITVDSSVPMQIEIYNSEGQLSWKTVLGSDYIPVNSTDFVQIICGAQAGTTDLSGGEFYIYFYDQNQNIRWDILDHIDTFTGERNRVSVDYLKALNGFQFSNIPDSSFIRVAKANNHNCELLLWDGCITGYPISGMTSVFNEDCRIIHFPENASASIQVPQSTLFLIAKPGYTFLSAVSSDSNVREFLPSSKYLLPAQVVNLSEFSGDCRPKNVMVVKGYDYTSKTYEPVMPTGDLSDVIIAVDDTSFKSIVPASTFLYPVYKNIDACMDFNWEAKATIKNSESAVSFRQGIQYHGIPYRSCWTEASSVGWHISKQTFMNAANDPDSIFYHTPSGQNEGPYYSLVCSSFGTLVTGFPYPMTNYSMIRDPQNHVRETAYPIIGGLMSNGTGHCFIPTNYFVESGGSSILTLAEQITPVTTIQNVYPGIVDSWNGIGLKSSYPFGYKYNITPSEFSDIPYDITSYTIKNGTARPYRGDQSVYTSDMDVLINIKDPLATRLYYQQFNIICCKGLPISVSACGKPGFIDIEPGTKQVNLRSATSKNNSFTGVALDSGAIYGVWAARGNVPNMAPPNVEFFEWYDLASEKIVYTVLDGKLVTDDTFWYSMTYAFGKDSYTNDSDEYGYLTIPYQPPLKNTSGNTMHSDYSNYADCASINSAASVLSFFRKGVFGAYVTGAVSASS